MNSESIVPALKAAILQLESEKARIDEQVEVLKDILRRFENLNVNAESALDVSSLANSPQPALERFDARRHRRTVNSPRNVIAEILEAEGPLHRSAIHKRLVEKGVHIGGRTPLSTVSTYLSVDDRFERVRRGVWQLSTLNDETAVDGDGDENDTDEEEEDVPW